FFSSRIRHTRSKRDWSSDVCSSDLLLNGTHQKTNSMSATTSSASSYVNPFMYARQIAPIYPVHLHDKTTGDYILDEYGDRVYDKIGRASCRERVYISVSKVVLKTKL